MPPLDPAALAAALLGPSFDPVRFLLVLTRVAALFTIAPVFGNTSVPVRFRVGLAVLISFLLFPLTRPISVPGSGALLIAVLAELTVGLLIGFLAQILFYSVQMAGHMVALQMGFGVERLIDPNSHTQVTGVGQFYNFAAMLTFLAVDGHHLLLRALARTFTRIPLGAFTLGALQVDRLVEATAGLFTTAFALMLPTLGVLLLIELSMAIAARVMPQMNAFVAGFPIKILVGIIALSTTLPLFSHHFERMVLAMAVQIVRFFG